MAPKVSATAAAPVAAREPETDLALQLALDRKVHWLSAWTIHHANHIRESRDGLKVGGHRRRRPRWPPSFRRDFGVLRPQDRVAVKPHASPAFHASNTSTADNR
jgi:pyruvate dehydrogenase E1 component